MTNFNLLEVLNSIEPHVLDYTEWLEVGMALKHEGYTATDWETWSAKGDPRYQPGECFKKWDTFEDSGITGATITQYAKDQGWESSWNTQGGGQALDWNSTISNEKLVVVDNAWVEDKEVHEPTDEEWQPHEQIIDYINTIFFPDEHIGYVMTSLQDDDGKHKPSSAGVYQKTAEQIVSDVKRYKDDIGAALGDYTPEAGAWIRFNPLDGKGAKNDNVADYRYALVESDETDIDRQNALLRELELPIAMLVHSGKKSLHAIVRIDANSLPEYKERVNYLYEVCNKNGLIVDGQNKNPSRLSRLPGIVRNGHKQFIVDRNIGKKDWDEWEEWIEDVNDDLPDPENLSEVWDDMPEKNPVLIDGVLRQGHKMLISGQSKAGKSFMLIELAIAIAEGRKWLGWDTAKGRVMYVNLELDSASGFHRFKDVYKALGYEPNNVSNIDIWNLRGKTAPMDKLAPKLIRRAEKQGYLAVIIDPIYKVLTGDENSAADMAHFTNQFDKIANELNCAVIYVHHHSKGTQGTKSSMDRASGSGVFARDPDAILDLIELEVGEGIKNQQAAQAACDVYAKWFREKNPNYLEENISRDDLLSPKAMTDHAKKGLKDYLQEADIESFEVADQVKKNSAWRVEGTLREFEKFEPRDMWFEYPIHKIDDMGVLKRAQPEHENPPWKKASNKNKAQSKSRKEQRLEALEEGFDSVVKNGKADIDELAETVGKSDRTIRSHVKEHPNFEIEDGFVVEKDEE